MIPPFPYYGGKSTLAPWLVSLLPEHGHYVEPFAGSLAVLLAKRPARMETVNDLDQDLITFWRVLRERPEDLVRACSLTPHARAELTLALDTAGGELEQARRVWVQLTQGRSGTLRRTGWRTYIDPAGSSTSMPGYLDGYRERIAAAAVRLMGVSLECRPALDVIADYGRSPRVLLYVDPPYLGNTRSSAGYRQEMPGEDAHRALAEALHTVRAAVVLSGYDSALYSDFYDGWHRVTRPTRTGNGGEHKARTEVVWSNRPMHEQHTFFDLSDPRSAT